MSFKEYLLGKRQRLSWVEEDSFAVGGDMAADGEVLGLNATIEPGFTQNWEEILSAGSGEMTVDNFEKGIRELPFTITFKPVSFKFLKYCGYDFTNTGSSPIVHTGSLVNYLQSFTLEWAIYHSNPVVFTLKGCGVLSVTISFSKGTGEGESLITVSMQCYAKSVEKGSVISSIDNITRKPFHFRHVKVTENNEEIVEINNGEITINRGIDPNDSRYCSTTLDGEVGELIPKVHRINGRYNVNVKDDTQFELWLSSEKVDNCKLEFIKDADDKVEFGLDNLVIPGSLPSPMLEGVINTDIVWRCKKFNPIEVRDDITY